jgi:hypothetical protein
MRMTPEDYADLKGRMFDYNFYKRLDGNVVIDHVIRWSWFSASIYGGGNVREGHEFICMLYGYLNDTHIDTALRKIVKELKQDD